MILPRRIPDGGRVALVAPAGPLPPGAIDRATARVSDMGWEPVVGVHAHASAGYLAGSDAGRAADLNAALQSDEVDAIWLLRGGYGTMRILDQIDFGALRHNPRPLIGFSDNTALHLAAEKADIVTFHGPHPATTHFSDFSRASLLKVLQPMAAGVLPQPKVGKPIQTITGGTTEGRLIGGSLSMLAATMGTDYQLDPDGAILFFEDVGEPAYRLDRLISQLLLGRVLDRVAGIVIGAINNCPDEDGSDRPDPAELFAERLARLGVPAAIGFAFGHIDCNLTIPLGVRAKLDAGAGTVEILEPAVDAG